MANNHGNGDGKRNTAKVAITVPSMELCSLIFWANKELTSDHLHIMRKLISRN